MPFDYMTMSSSILTLLGSQVTQEIIIGIVVFFITSALAFLYRKGIVSHLRRSWLWITNGEIKMKRITIYMSSSRGDWETVKRFLDLLRDERNGFAVYPIEGRKGEFSISISSYNVLLRVTDQLIEDAGNEVSGISLRVEIKDPRVPYRTGLPVLLEIIPKVKSCMDQAFGKAASNFSIKAVLERNPSKAGTPKEYSVRKDQKSKVTLSTEGLSIQSYDVNDFSANLRSQLFSPFVTFS